MRASARSTTTSSIAGDVQALEHQVEDLEVGLEAGVAVDLGAELQRLARRAGAAGARVQHRPAVAQPGHAAAVQQVRVDARDLRRAVGAQAERAAAQLVDQLEGLQVELVAGARQQRLDVLEQRRHDQLEADSRAAASSRPRRKASMWRARAGRTSAMCSGKSQAEDMRKRRGIENGIVPAACARRVARRRTERRSGPERQQHRQPASMLTRPRKRIWPSLICKARSKMRRQRRPG